MRVNKKSGIVILFCIAITSFLTTIKSQADDLNNDQVAATANSNERTNILTSSNDSVEMNFLNQDGVEKFEISKNNIKTGSPLDYKVLNLTAPNRLVLDIKNVKIVSSKTVPLSESKYVTAVRLGKHDDKSRIVLDLTSNKNLKTEVSEDDKTIIISLIDQDSKNSIVKKDVELARNEKELTPNDSTDLNDYLAAGPDRKLATVEAPAPAAVMPVTDAQELDRLENENNAATEAKERSNQYGQNVKPSKVENTVVDTVNGKAVLSSLIIDDSSIDSQSIKASVSAPTRITLKKTAPSEYVARLKGAALSDDSIQTVLSENPKSGIRSVRPVQEGEDVILRIFAKPNVALEANIVGDSLVISEPSIERAIAKNMDRDLVRAQNSEAKVEPKKEEPPIVVADRAGIEKKPVVKVSDKKETTKEITNDDIGKVIEGGAPKYTGRLISLDLQDTDIDNALRIIAEVSNLNIIASDEVTGKVTLRLIDVPWDQALDVILKTNGLDKVSEGNVVRIAPVEKLRLERESLKQAKTADQELEDTKVEYLRVNYAKASEMKPLLDQVITERGSVTFDERTNQVIIKDIGTGLAAAKRLVSKLDMRTPQVLLETQIVEANRSLLRDLGSQFGFRYVQSPETGNPTGYNFPNAIDLGTSFANPAASVANKIDLLFSSADGTKSLSESLTLLETEGRVRVVSRPSVATTNNKQAEIKSVQKFRIRLPNGGVSVATGQGAQAAGQGSAATETVEIGIVLNVTPQASPDYYVLLDINAKSSTLGPIIGTDGIPSEIERAATSSVLVSSGQTFGLGGIYKITDNSNVSGVPFFKDIPFFGHLFRRTSVDNSDEELLFFITPRIVEGSFDDAAMKASN